MLEPDNSLVTMTDLQKGGGYENPIGFPNEF